MRCSIMNTFRTTLAKCVDTEFLMTFHCPFKGSIKYSYNQTTLLNKQKSLCVFASLKSTASDVHESIECQSRLLKPLAPIV